jgi:hypothetical protein
LWLLRFLPHGAQDPETINVFQNPEGPGTKNDCAGEGQHQFIRPTSPNLMFNFGSFLCAKEFAPVGFHILGKITLFRRNILPQSSGIKSKAGKRKSKS